MIREFHYTRSGNAASVAQLRSPGLTVHLPEPNRVENIAGELERIGLLAGTAATADTTARGKRGK